MFDELIQSAQSYVNDPSKLMGLFLLFSNFCVTAMHASVDGLIHTAKSIASMTGAQMFVVGILWPSFILFIMLHIPVVAWMAMRVLNAAHKSVRILICGFPRPLSLFYFLAITTTIMVIRDLLAHQVLMEREGARGKDAPNLAMEFDYKSKKWRSERDLYMGLAAALITWSLDRIGALRSSLKKVEDENKKIRAATTKTAKKQ